MSYCAISALDDDDALIFGGGINLDSMGAMELIGLTESHFNIEYQEDDLTEAHFKSVRTLSDLLARLTTPRNGSTQE
jgi:acyl carrier protein